MCLSSGIGSKGPLLISRTMVSYQGSTDHLVTAFEHATVSTWIGTEEAACTVQVSQALYGIPAAEENSASIAAAASKHGRRQVIANLRLRDETLDTQDPPSSPIIHGKISSEAPSGDQPCGGAETKPRDALLGRTYQPPAGRAVGHKASPLEVRSKYLGNNQNNNLQTGSRFVTM